MAIYLTRRKKLILISLAFGLLLSAIGTSGAYYKQDYQSKYGIQYLTISPSIILKNNPNTDNFSPVANTDYIQPPPKKEVPEAPKPTPPSETEKKPVYIPEIPTVKKTDIKPEINLEEKSKAKKNETAAIIIAPTILPNPPKSDLSKNQPAPAGAQTVLPKEEPIITRPRQNAPIPKKDEYQRVDLSGKYGSAIQTLIQRTRYNISARTTEKNRIEQHIEDLNFQREQKEKSVYWDEKIHKGKDWDKIINYEISLEQHQLDRQNQDLKHHNNRLARLQRGELDQIEFGFLEQGYSPDPDSDGWIPKNDWYRRSVIKNNASGIAPYGSSWENNDSTVLSSLRRQGWTKTVLDANSEQVKSFQSQGVSSGIKLIQYQKEKENNLPVQGNYNSFSSLVLDASDSNALSKFSSILESLEKTQQDLKEVVLENVKGEYSSTIEGIIAKLPKKILSLRLFVEDPEGLLALSKLENHKLLELSLYSNRQNDDGAWAINPNALKNVDFVKWDYVDKPNIKLYNPALKLPGSIRFDTLTWSKDQSNTSKINEGLKIAFGSKINQRVFQGYFGGRGGYPPNLDFSKTNIKTLKGIDFDGTNKYFNDEISTWETDTGIKEQANFYLKFKNLSFGIDEDWQPDLTNSSSEKKYTVKLEDFDGQFGKRLNFGPHEFSRIELKDKSGKQVQNATLVLNGNYSEVAKSDLINFLKAAKRSNAFSKIVIDSSLFPQLGSNFEGLPVEVKTNKK